MYTSVKPTIFLYSIDSVPSHKWQGRTINVAALSVGCVAEGFTEAYNTPSNSADMTPDAQPPPKERKDFP